MNDIRVSHSLSLYQLKDESAFPIPVSEWNCLKSKVSRIGTQHRIYRNLASLFFGIFASAIMALIAFYAGAEIVKPWVLPTAWAVCIGSLILGIVLIVIDDQQKSLVSQSTQAIVDDMESIERRHTI